MKQLIGKVVRVFIPGENVDRKVTFQVETAEGIYEIKEEQTEENAKIYKDDTVLLTFQNISGKEFMDISLYEEGELDE